MTMTWWQSGKLKRVTQGTLDVAYRYGPSGERWIKRVEDTSYYYMRDAQGNILAMYKKVGTTVQIRERHLYGSSRLGIYDSVTTLQNDTAALHWPGVYTYQISRGRRKYELTNHLGNVMAVITDRRTPRIASSTVQNYLPDVVQKGEYYSFGADLPGWGTLTNHVHGFNGKLEEKEVGVLDFGARMYDAKTGRWMSLDSKYSLYPHLSPYSAMNDNPLLFSDNGGEENVIYLMLLPSAKQTLKQSDVESVIKQTQEMYKTTLGLNVEVKVFSPAYEGPAMLFNVKHLDPSDVVVALGNPQEVGEFVTAQSRNAEYVKDVQSWKSDESNPEKSENFQAPYGRIVAIDPSAASTAAPTFKTEANRFISFPIVHGSGHNVGIDHSGDITGDPFPIVNRKSIMASGKDMEYIINGYYSTLKGSFEDFLLPENNVEAKIHFSLKFSSGLPVDNYQKNFIADRDQTYSTPTQFLDNNSDPYKGK